LVHRSLAEITAIEKHLMPATYQQALAQKIKGRQPKLSP